MYFQNSWTWMGPKWPTGKDPVLPSAMETGNRNGRAWDEERAQNHRMVWVGRDLKDHLIPTPLPWAGTSSTRPGCPKPHPAWPWTLPGRGQPQLSGQPVPVPQHPHDEEFLPYIWTKSPLFQFKAITPCPALLALHSLPL